MIIFNIPEPATHLGLEFKFKEFFGYVLDNIPEFQTSLTLSRRAMKIMDVVDPANTGDQITISDIDTFTRIVTHIRSETFVLPVLSIMTENKSSGITFPSRLIVKFCDVLEQALDNYKPDDKNS